MRFRRLSPHIRATAATLVLSGFLSISLSGQTNLTNEITDMLRDELDLDRIAVTLVDTEATLAGEVPTLWDKTRAINQTLAVEGVETLVSEITIPGGENDNDLAGQVGQAIRTYRFMTIWDYVGGGVEDGVVTLTGAVSPERDKGADLFERIAKIRGVQDIQLQVVQQSSSRMDTNLRQRIASQALRHPTLSHYNLVADIPPFRIVVDESVVMLVGAVRSGTESQVLESIARQAFETGEVINRLQYPQ
jgi:osmotically-inducible protein OsmY